MSLLIPDTGIHNLYHNGKKVKAAYLNGEKVWTEKHRVDWRLDDDAQTVVKTEYVTDGESAVPPVVQEWTDDFHSYIINGWNTAYDEISADTAINAQSRTMTVYLLRNGYGLNLEFNAELGVETDIEVSGVSFRDNTSGMDYTSVAAGKTSTSGITCNHTGERSARYNKFRAARYKAFLLDADAIRTAGFSRLRFTGSYRFGTGEIYSTSNLRVAFVAIQTGSTVTTTTAAGVQSENKWQVRYHYNAGNAVIRPASAVSGTINGMLDIPESGAFYVIVGELTKAFKGTAEIKVDSMWVE